MMMLRFLGALLVVVLLAVAGCGKGEESGGSGGKGAAEGKPAVPAGQRLDLVFVYGSEKESWIKETTAAFNNARNKTKDGKIIQVDARPMGSGESIDEILAGNIKAHLVSPASAAFIKLGNAQSRVKSGSDLVGPTDNLVVSPVVIAMWKPMAEALGWPGKPVGWSDILALTKDPNGWASRGHAEWGSFKFGHTHPEYSNSGLITALAVVYAGAGKTEGLTSADVSAPQTAAFLGDIEKSVVHYGSSTGFFGKKMFANGPGYLSAAVMYENMVIESYTQPNRDQAFPVVAIYPKEGTFWSDHPVGVVQREWVTPAHQEAARIYIDYLLATPQQQRALAYGFRPAATGIPLAEPIDAAHGVNPKEPANVLPVPDAEVMNQIIALWRANKKHANVVLVFDTSGSMNQDGKITNARAGAAELVNMLHDEDTLSLLPFSTDYRWAGRNLKMKSSRGQALGVVNGLIADGDTKLFDSIDVAYQSLSTAPDAGRISAVVVLTDGADTISKLKLEQLLQRIHSNSEKKPIRVFTIGYGSDAKKDELKKIADETQAKFYEGNPQNIRQVFKDIATFF